MGSTFSKQTDSGRTIERMPIDEDKKNQLIKTAITAREKSYSPYSQFKVGSALLTESGKVYLGCNVENVAYGSSVCSERVTILKAVSEGERKFLAIAVVTENGGAPCGECRQVMREFSPDLTVIISNTSGIAKTYSLAELLPSSFGPENLTVT